MFPSTHKHTKAHKDEADIVNEPFAAGLSKNRNRES